MRLARGSGLDGLAGMAPLARLGSLWLLRPLLDTPKARLRATLEARGIPWIEDPSNQSLAFERTRLRAAGEALAALGLTGEMLALSARRLQRARTALDCIADELLRRAGARSTPTPAASSASTASGSPGRPRRSPCACSPAALPPPAGRTSRCRSASSSRSSTACAAARTQKAGSWTLARALITAAPDAIQVEREPGRQPPPYLTLARRRQHALWDGRFAVAVAAELRGAPWRCARWAPRVWPSCAVSGGPSKARGRSTSCRRSGRKAALLAVPALDFWANPDLEGRLSADFVGLRYNSGVPGARRNPGIRPILLSICRMPAETALSASNLANILYTPMLQSSMGHAERRRARAMSWAKAQGRGGTERPSA